uniref:Uncharacterized protein n=1 Tax=Arundo donax TaxID=35708 RepID=A0A0A8YXC7_ARUDO
MVASRAAGDMAADGESSSSGGRNVGCPCSTASSAWYSCASAGIGAPDPGPVSRCTSAMNSLGLAWMTLGDAS